MKRFKIIGILLVVALFGGGTGSIQNSFAAQDIEIAFMVPLTGSGAFYGKVMRDVGKGIVDEINEGGIKGFGKMKVSAYDIASDPAIAIQQMERAVMQGANIIWGGFNSAEEKAMAAKADELKIPYVMNNSTSYESFPRSRRFAVNPHPGSYELGVATEQYFVREKVRSYGVMGADYIWTRSWDKTVTLKLKGTDIKKVYENLHEFSKVDFSADIAKLKEIKPDALLRMFAGTGEYSEVKQMKDANYWPRVYVGELAGGCPQVLLDQVGEKYAVGVTNASTQNPANPKWVEFARKHLQKFNYRPTWFSDGINDTLYLIKKAIENAGTLDAEKLNKVIHATSFDGVSGYPCGPFQEWGGAEKSVIYILKYVEGPPAWSNKVGVHREVLFKTEVKPLCKEEIEALLKDVK